MVLAGLYPPDEYTLLLSVLYYGVCIVVGLYRIQASIYIFRYRINDNTILIAFLSVAIQPENGVRQLCHTHYWVL